MASTQHAVDQPDAGRLVRIGGWLFERRTWTPAPLLLVLLATPSGDASSSRPLLAASIAIVTAGELLRLWAVHHIGVISRTRSNRLGPLVSTGPFQLVRNPLYLGNIALWVGFALGARLVWMVPVVIFTLGFEYHAIVRWEERLLESRRGEEYHRYAARVPRWIPLVDVAMAARAVRPARADAVVGDTNRPRVLHSWRETFFSERGTLIAIAAGYALLYLKLTA